MTTTFGRQKPLSDAAKEALFGDIDIPLDPIETTAPATDEVETPPVEPPEEPEAPADDPAQVNAEEGVIEAAPGEPETPPEVPDPALDEAEVGTAEEVPPLGADETWKQRYDAIRTAQMPALERERARAELAESQLALLLQKTTGIPQEELDALTKRAEEMGLDPEQVALYSDISSKATAARTQPVIDALTAQAQQARQSAEQAQAAADADLVASWTQVHPDLDDTKQAEVARFLHDVGDAYFIDPNSGEAMPNEEPYDSKLARGGQLRSYEPLSPDMLERAYTAVVTDPALGEVLRLLPQLIDNEAGMAMAQRLASRQDPPATTRPDAAAISASLAAADTLTGPSAPAPAEREAIFDLPDKKVTFSK